MSSTDAEDGRRTVRSRRGWWRRPWVSPRTLLVFWALWLPCLAFVLLTPSLRQREVVVPHPGEPGLRLSLVNGSRHNAALVIGDERSGGRRIEWLPDTSRGLSDTARPAGPLNLAVVTSSLSFGPVTSGEDDLFVPAAGTARVLVREDGSGTVLDPGEAPADEADEAALAAAQARRADLAGAEDTDGRDSSREAFAGTDSPRAVFAGTEAARANPAAGAAPAYGATFVNGSARVLHGIFLGDDGARIEHFDQGAAATVVGSRALVPGEHLHASWELAAPVTEGGTPQRIDTPGDVTLQVRVFPDGSWEIGEPSALALLRLKLAMFLAVLAGR